MDNNIRFENVYTRTPEIYGEYYDTYQKTAFPHLQTINKVSTVYIAVGLVIIFACMGLLSVMDAVEDAVLIGVAMLVVVLLLIFTKLFRVLMKRQTVKRGIAIDKELNGGELAEICTTVTESGLCSSIKGKGASEVSFDSIKYMARSKNLIILVTEARQVFIIKEDSFVQGSAEELWSFLKAKGIEIRK